jgi:hypothetical protein
MLRGLEVLGRGNGSLTPPTDSDELEKSRETDTWSFTWSWEEAEGGKTIDLRSSGRSCNVLIPETRRFLF